MRVSALIRPLMATPRAATMPTSNFLGAAGGADLSALAVAVAALVSFASAAASAAAARLATCASIMRMNFLYGDQKAWRMEIGLSMILETVASQSRPLRS